MPGTTFAREDESLRDMQIGTYHLESQCKVNTKLLTSLVSCYSQDVISQ